MVNSMRFETKAVHEGVAIDKSYNSVITPIYPTSTFAFDEIGKNRGFDYTRSGNPTRAALAKNLAALEGGTDAWITCTGMAAETSVLFLFKQGDHLVTGNDIYGGTYRLLTSAFDQFGLECSFVDMQDPAQVEKAIRPNTKGIWIETPSNPLLNIVDMEAVVGIAKKHNLITICDNTFLSPYFQRPFEFGMDIVVHSTTKYLNGHSDVVGGAVIVNKPEHAEKVGFYVNCLGTAGSPFDAWLVLRGVKTLPQRMEAHQKGAMTIARHLTSHPFVKHVYYPGLETHPRHELAQRQMYGFGGMVSCELDTDKVNPTAFFNQVKLMSLAESLGGVETLIEQPWSMSHASMPEDARITAGITPGTVRISVGLEHPDDLIADLAQALEKAKV